MPILLSPVKWDTSEIANFTILPKNLKPVESWKNQDSAFKHIADKLERVIVRVMNTPTTDEVTRSAGAAAAGSEAPEGIEIFHCVPNFLRPPPPVREVGVTELLPDLVLRFKGECGERRFADISLFANTNITSRISGATNLSEVTLLVASGQCLARLPTLSRGIQAIQSGVNSLTFLQVPLHELNVLPPPERNLRVLNLRVNAALLGPSTGMQSAALHLYMRVTDVTVHPRANFAMATTGGHFSVIVDAADSSIDLKHLPQSRSLNAGLLQGEVSSTRLSFLVKCDGLLAGFEAPDARTLVMVAFHGLPEGVTLFAGAEEISGSPEGLRAKLIRSDLRGHRSSEKPRLSGHGNFAHGWPVGMAALDAVQGNACGVREIAGVWADRQHLSLGFAVAY